MELNTSIFNPPNKEKKYTPKLTTDMVQVKFGPSPLSVHGLQLFFFVKIVSTPDEKLFSETFFGRTASYFV